MRDTIRKLHTTRGMSLGEALVTVLIMSFVTLAIVAGVTAGVRVYHRITMRAEEQTLLATNVAALSEYLEKGIGINSEGDSISIKYSEVDQAQVKIYNNGSNGIYIQYFGENGKETNLKPQPLVSSKINTTGLYANFTAEVKPQNTTGVSTGGAGQDEQLESDQRTTFRIDIYDQNGKKTNESEQVTVKNTIQYPKNSDTPE